MNSVTQAIIAKVPLFGKSNQNKLNVNNTIHTANHIQKHKNNCHFNQNHSFLYNFSSFSTTNLLFVIFQKNLTTPVFSIEKKTDIVITITN
jgi:hypothetical protein